jgi:hypothetical protein
MNTHDGAAQRVLVPAFVRPIQPQLDDGTPVGGKNLLTHLSTLSYRIGARARHCLNGNMLPVAQHWKTLEFQYERVVQIWRSGNEFSTQPDGRPAQHELISYA